MKLSLDFKLSFLMEIDEMAKYVEKKMIIVRIKRETSWGPNAGD